MSQKHVFLSTGKDKFIHNLASLKILDTRCDPYLISMTDVQKPFGYKTVLGIGSSRVSRDIETRLAC
jgi:hypothetical protein